MVGKEQRKTSVATWYLEHCDSAHPLLRNCSLENFPEALSLKIPLDCCGKFRQGNRNPEEENGTDTKGEGREISGHTHAPRLYIIVIN